MSETRPGPPWWRTVPPAETSIPCGRGRHTVRWVDGGLVTPAHPDAEAELVLAALGGETAACTDLAGAWARHAANLDVLALGPRSAADQPSVGWDDIELIRSTAPTGMIAASAQRISRVYRRQPGGGGVASGVAAGFATSPAAPRPGRRVLASHVMFKVSEEDDGARARRIELLSLFALGPAFWMRLAGTVAAAWAEADGGAGSGGPALVAALTGRLALAVESWLGVDPGLVSASLHTGPGWGSLEWAGAGTADAAGESGVRARLPVDWLARVWAAGLAVAGGHLVVAVLEARWPDAEVLAVPEPGADPVRLSLRAGSAVDGSGAGDAGGAGEGWPRWDVVAR